MRKARAPHRLGIGKANPALVAGRERRRDAARAAGKPGLDMRGQPGPQRAARHPRPHHAHRAIPPSPKATSGRTDAFKPGDPRIVIGAGHSGHWRRKQPRAQANYRPRSQIRQRIADRQIDADARRQGDGLAITAHRRPATWPQPQPDQRARGQRLDALDPRGKFGHDSTRKPGRRHPLRPPPDHCHAQRGKCRRHRHHAARPPAPVKRPRADTDRARDQQPQNPSLPAREHEPHRNARPERHGHPKHQLIALQLQPALDRARHRPLHRHRHRHFPIPRSRKYHDGRVCASAADIASFARQSPRPRAHTGTQSSSNAISANECTKVRLTPIMAGIRTNQHSAIKEHPP